MRKAGKWAPLSSASPSTGQRRGGGRAFDACELSRRLSHSPQSPKLKRQVLASAESLVQSLPTDARCPPSCRHCAKHGPGQADTSALSWRATHIDTPVPTQNGTSLAWTSKSGSAGERSKPQCPGCAPGKSIGTPGGGAKVTAFAKAPGAQGQAGLSAPVLGFPERARSLREA